jgi:hypothetical protein
MGQDNHAVRPCPVPELLLVTALFLTYNSAAGDVPTSTAYAPATVRS